MSNAIMKTEANRGLVLSNHEDMARFAKTVAASGLSPKGMEKPETIYVAVQMGLELGLSPMQAVQRIAVVNGRPTIWGDAALALVRGSGLMDGFREWSEDDTSYCMVHRVGDTEPITRSFSDADAKAAGLLGKQGPWTQYKSRMRQMRARSFALRDAFPDVLLGLYFREELDDQAPIKDVTPSAIPDPPERPKKPSTIVELVEAAQEQPSVPDDEEIEPFEGDDAVEEEEGAQGDEFTLIREAAYIKIRQLAKQLNLPKHELLNMFKKTSKEMTDDELVSAVETLREMANG